MKETERLRKRLALATVLGFLMVFLGQGCAFINANSQTFDEAIHLGAGYSNLLTGDFRLNIEHPPLSKELAALPVFLRYRLPFNPDPELWKDAEGWRIGRDFLYKAEVPHDDILAIARMPNLVLGAVLVGLIAWWAYRLWGAGAAVVAAGAAALEPNLVAHASLVTPDLCITLFTFLTFYLLWEYIQAPSHKLLTAVGISTGLAQVSKFSAVLLFGIMGVVIGLHLLGGGCFAFPRGAGSAGAPERRSAGLQVRLRSRAREALGPAFRILLLALLVIPFFYWIYAFPTWAGGLQTQLARAATPQFPVFFLGEVSWQGWWTYFPVAFLIKTPLGTLLLLVAGLALCRLGKPLHWPEVLFLLVPPALLLILTASSRVNIGLRYILPVYPFLLVFAGRVATVRIGSRAWSRFVSPLLVVVPLALTAASVLPISPHHLAYFNELVGGAGQGHRYLSDSNLDWGQGLKGLKAYLDRERVPMIYLSYFGTAPPASYGIRYQYLPGFGHLESPSGDLLPAECSREILAISVVNLQELYLPKKNLYRWLEERTPVAKIGYSIYVFDLTGDAEAHRRLAEVYRKTGSLKAAELEFDKARRMSKGKNPI